MRRTARRRLVDHVFTVSWLSLMLQAEAAPTPVPKLPQPGQQPIPQMASAPTITVQVPGNAQKPGSNMSVGAKVVQGGTPVEGVTVSFALDSAIPLGTAKTYPNGIATLSFKLPADRGKGSHTIVADTPAEKGRLAGHGYATFEIADKAVSAKLFAPAEPRKGDTITLRASADEDGSPLKTGHAVFLLEKTYLGDSDFDGSGAELKWTVPLDLPTGSHQLFVRVVDHVNGLSPLSAPARATAQTTPNFLPPILYLEAPQVTRHHRESAGLSGILYLSKTSKLPAPKQELVLSWEGLGDNCTATTDAAGKFSCGGMVIKSSVVPQSYALAARLKNGDKVVADGSLLVEKDPPGKIGGDFVTTVFAGVFKNSVLILNSYGPRHGDSWHLKDGSWFRLGGPSNPTKNFDIAEMKLGPIRYYVNNVSLRSLDGTIENGRFKMVAVFNDSNPEIKGRCAGSDIICAPGNDSTAPDAQMDDMVITILLTPAAWNGTIAFSDADVTFSGNPSINGACHIPGVGDVCEAFGHYKERIKSAIEGGIRSQVDSDLVRSLFGTPFGNVVTANRRGAVTKAWMDAAGNIFYEAPIVD